MTIYLANYITHEHDCGLVCSVDDDEVEDGESNGVIARRILGFSERDRMVSLTSR